MKILLVGPGLMPIPSNGWGAVETVIWQLKTHLEKNGCKVDILNKRGIIAALKIKPWTYDIVHLEYDDLAFFWITLSKVLNFKLVITSHYGYSAWPNKWHRSYRKIFKQLIKSPALIVLSNEIRDTYLKLGYKGILKVLSNGTEINEIDFRLEGEKDLICLGKIESRKRQTELSNLFSSQNDIKLDFVGPIVDKNFTYNNLSTFYLGSWDRDQVKHNLSNYKAMILLSDGEAHALVVGEALAAGLSLIISEEAAANLDRSLPFIKILEKDNDVIDVSRKIILQNKENRLSIRKYAEDNFDWNNIAKKYIVIINDIIKELGN